MKIRIRSHLPCEPKKVWREIKKPSVHAAISSPMVKFICRDATGFPSVWTEGKTCHVDVLLFGLVPLGRHAIHAARVDDEHWVFQTEEFSAFIKRWSHAIRISPKGKGTQLIDDLVFDAGWWSLSVWSFAQIFYRYRQLRLSWRMAETRLPGMDRLSRFVEPVRGVFAAVLHG